MEPLRVMLCCIGRLENPYIREFVEYYKSLGVTNICLYDNNFDGEEDFRDVISDYIDSGYVILKNIRNKRKQQPDVYAKCYNEYGDKYDWFCFFDCDEFLHLEKDNNISEFLRRKYFDNFNTIVVSWKIYDDNDQVYYTNRPLLERFTRECDTDWYHNEWKFYVKTIVRGHQGPIIWHDASSHFPERFITHIISTCDESGNKIDMYHKTTMDPHYNVAYLKHIECKTIEEFCKIKLKRGWADGSNCYLNLDYFFEKNKKTSEKQKAGQMFINEGLKGIKP